MKRNYRVGERGFYIEPISLEELQKLAQSDAGHFELLDAMRRYSDMLVIELTESEVQSS